MVIDMHIHPLLWAPVCEDPAEVSFRKENFGLYKAGAVPINLTLSQMDECGIDQSVLLPLDLSSKYNKSFVTNKEIKKLVDFAPKRLIGFASIDPFDKDAVDKLEIAFRDLNLAGLKLNPSKQSFYPGDERLRPIYNKCIAYNKPIIFHAGMSWEPDALAVYSQPVQFEQVAYYYPKLRICLSHFGWPWIYETIMLLLKYPNVYADTSLTYLDSPEEFIHHVFTQNMGQYWLDRNINKKVMFGSNYPRFRPDKMKQAVEKLPVRETTLQDIFANNFQRFMGSEVL